MKAKTALERIEKVANKRTFAYRFLKHCLTHSMNHMPVAKYSGNGRFTRLLDYTSQFEEILKLAKIKYKVNKPSHLKSPIHYTLILTHITF